MRIKNEYEQSNVPIDYSSMTPVDFENPTAVNLCQGERLVDDNGIRPFCAINIPQTAYDKEMFINVFSTGVKFICF